MSMDTAYKSSGKIFHEVTQKRNPGLVEQLESIQPGEIFVVQGKHDNVETLLDTLKVPYKLMSSDDFAKQNGGRVAFFNCKEYGSGVPIKAVQDFAEKGGRIITTDWSLGVVSHAFPGKLYKERNTSDDVVEIRCANDLGRMFIGMNYAQCHPKWWLESSSHIYKTGEGVIDIFTSEEMRRKYGQNHVAVGFQHGAGEVFHFISHFVLQRTHQKTAADKGTLDDFLKKMQVQEADGLEEANVAELEAAFSTLSTVAYLCSPLPLIYSGSSSIMRQLPSGNTKKSSSLL